MMISLSGANARRPVCEIEEQPATNAFTAKAGTDNTGCTRDHDWNRSLVVLDCHALRRQCLVHGLVTHRIRMHVAGVASMQEWKSVDELHPPLAVILLSVGGRKFADQSLVDEVTCLISEFRPVPVVVLAESEDVLESLKAADCGVRGYIPSTVGVKSCIEAINLAMARSTFVPASCEVPEPISSMFTPREAAVVKALREGKPNKIIAYELHMSENTVKGHMRNILAKLKATNRTEATYKINSLVTGRIGR